ncbi:hypothetical protein [Sedimenticola sp.]|uniref:hypothetical protein n=1 Tax=Sedimenticola sp. TaxID=1940285 RepID=UPI003D0E8184
MVEITIDDSFIENIHEYEEKRLEWLSEKDSEKSQALGKEIQILEQLIAISTVLAVKNQTNHNQHNGELYE